MMRTCKRKTLTGPMRSNSRHEIQPINTKHAKVARVLAAFEIFGTRKTFFNAKNTANVPARYAANATLSHSNAMIHEQSATSFHSNERAFSDALGSVSGTVERTKISNGAHGRVAATFSCDVSQDFT